MIADAILRRFPTSAPRGDWLVQDDGEGPYIAYWNAATLGVPSPDAGTLAAWAALPDPNAPNLSPRQLRLALLSIGVTEAQVDVALENDAAGTIEWKYATYYRRSHPLIDALGALFALPPEQIDSLWDFAADL